MDATLNLSRYHILIKKITLTNVFYSIYGYSLTIRLSPPPLLSPQNRRPRRQLEQRHLGWECLVQDRCNDVGYERGQVHHVAHVAVVDSLMPGDLLH